MKLLRRRRKPLTLAVLAGSLAYSLAGCSSSNGGPATDGPLTGGSLGSPGGGFVCLTGHVGQPQTFGDESFTNQSRVTVVLDRVALRRPRHERLIGSYAVPGQYLIGTVLWPPRHPVNSPDWKDRGPVHGFRLAPGKSFNMVLGVAATASGHATSQGMKIYYHDTAGSSYLAVDPFKMLIDVTEQGC